MADGVLRLPGRGDGVPFATASPSKADGELSEWNPVAVFDRRPNGISDPLSMTDPKASDVAEDIIIDSAFERPVSDRTNAGADCPTRQASRSSPAVASDALLLFGITGDLSRRMLLPSLFKLDADELLPEDLRILGAAREALNDELLRDLTREVLSPLTADGRYSEAQVERFLERLHYVAVDLADADTFEQLRICLEERPPRALAILLSTPPNMFERAIKGLQRLGLAISEARLALEKPLGTDLRSSQRINDAVGAVFPEENIFRIDHYLGKETVQNLLALRFGNTLFEPLWNAQGIDHIQITVAETVGIEGRTSYYDGTGSLRDMVQNHMLQLLALVAMEPPARFGADEVRDEKVKVLRSLRPIDPKKECVIGQYDAGAIRGHPVPGYSDELGYSSGTETFAALKAHVDNWRWRGVPFYLRTGKRLPERVSEIVVQFRGVPHSIFNRPAIDLSANRLIISIQPEENIRLSIMTKQPGLDREGIRLREVALDIRDATAASQARRPIAYERLLLDLIEGERTLFVRRDEVEAQWQWIDAIRRGWAEAGMTPKAYPAGTWGPSAAIAMAERAGVTWHE